MILSTLINHYLDSDPEKAQKLCKHDGKILEIHIRPINISMLIIIQGMHIELSFKNTLPPNATISGTPLNLAALFMTKKSNNTEITGDILFVQDFNNILADIDVDWEEQLSHITGDVAAHTVGNFIRKIYQTRHSVKRNITEYLQEEATQFPPRAEIEDFYHEVDNLRHATERLDARLNLWEKEPS